MLALLIGAIADPVLTLDLRNETYAQLAREIQKQSLGEVVSVGGSLNGRKVILLCENQPFADLRAATEELLDLQWTKTDSGWRIDRSPQALAREAAKRQAEQSLAEQALRDLVPFIGGHRASPPSSLSQSALKDCREVQESMQGVFKRIAESSDLTQRLVRGDTLFFSTEPKDGFITALMYNGQVPASRERVRLKYRASAQTLELLHCQVAADESPDLVRTKPKLIRLKPDVTQLPADSSSWPRQAPDSLHLPISSQTPLPKSAYHGNLYSLADHAAYLHQATGAPMMMEGSRQAVSNQIPQVQDAGQYLNRLMDLSRGIGVLRSVAGIRTAGPWVSVRLDYDWRLGDELPEEAVQTMENRWRSGRKLDFAEYAQQFKDLTEAQEEMMETKNPPQLVAFPSIPLQMYPRALFRFWSGLNMTQKRSLNEGMLAATDVGAQNRGTFLDGIAQFMLYVPIPEDVQMAAWSGSLPWPQVYFTGKEFSWGLFTQPFTGAHESLNNTEVGFYTVQIITGSYILAGLGIPVYKPR